MEARWSFWASSPKARNVHNGKIRFGTIGMMFVSMSFFFFFASSSPRFSSRPGRWGVCIFGASGICWNHCAALRADSPTANCQLPMANGQWPMTNCCYVACYPSVDFDTQASASMLRSKILTGRKGPTVDGAHFNLSTLVCLAKLPKKKVSPSHFLIYGVLCRVDSLFSLGAYPKLRLHVGYVHLHNHIRHHFFRPRKERS